ncbi:MAG: ABC transporter ATP-binding protein [Treponema sp.]|nr:ABC transporter ATP-binding protein [Treponema sp.]MBQ5382976.1 ABC transporter ATP-binding protein [Treponema sp.]
MERDEIKKESQNLLEVEHLSVTFNQYSMGTERRSLEVIHDISLSVKSGEIVAVIGASGSGKSLLAHAIMGILPVNAVTKGNVIFEGKVLSEKDKENLRGKKIALIPQSVSYLDPMMTVKNQIESPLKRRDSKKGIVQSLMEKFQLKKEVATQYPFELSGGMARRVLIGTAITSGAKLIIADEPTPGMHMSVVEETLKAFKKMAEDGAGILMITHDIDLAFTIADRVAVFCDGRVVSVEETENFVSHPERLTSAYARALWHALPQNGFFVEDGKVYNADMSDSEESLCAINKKREAV